MIKIYIIKRKDFSPFTNQFSEAYLRDKGIVYTKNPLSADVLMADSTELRSYKLAQRLFSSKKFITWTNEPRHNHKVDNFHDKDRIIMNVYSGNVFLNNLHFLGSYHYDFSNDLGINLRNPPAIPLTVEQLNAKKKFCVAVFAYRDPKKSELIINGTNVDLNARRQELAYFMYQRDKADIVGGNWPQFVQTKESSGFDNGHTTWWDRKINLLQDYKFNICFENTISPYYCTEKIWHAIAGGCLPIYYGEGTSIYETFPENSFIDAANFTSNKDLLHFLENLSPLEHVKRYNTCLKVMQNACIERLQNPGSKTDITDQFINSVRKLVLSTHPE